MNDADDQRGQCPVGVIENKRHPREERRSHQRQKRNSEDKECDRNNDQVCQQRNRCDQVEVPKNQRQRTNPCRKRHRCATAKPFIAGVNPSAWTAYQALRQKRIRSRTPLEKSEERVGQQHNCANYSEGKLEPGGKQFVCIPAQNEKRRCREAVWQKYSSFEEVAADED